MICCVRRATRAASSLGRARASSIAFVWSDCVPPRRAAIAWRATRTTLLWGCWAVSVRTGRLRVEAELLGPRILGLEAVAHDQRQRRRAARNFAISSMKSLWALKKKLTRRPRRSGERPRLQRRPLPCLGDAVGQREASSCAAVEPGLADVVADTLMKFH